MPHLQIPAPKLCTPLKEPHIADSHHHPSPPRSSQASQRAVLIHMYNTWLTPTALRCHTPAACPPSRRSLPQGPSHCRAPSIPNPARPAQCWSRYLTCSASRHSTSTAMGPKTWPRKRPLAASCSIQSAAYLMPDRERMAFRALRRCSLTFSSWLWQPAGQHQVLCS